MKQSWRQASMQVSNSSVAKLWKLEQNTSEQASSGPPQFKLPLVMTILIFLFKPAIEASWRRGRPQEASSRWILFRWKKVEDRPQCKSRTSVSRNINEEQNLKTQDKAGAQNGPLQTLASGAFALQCSQSSFQCPHSRRLRFMSYAATWLERHRKGESIVFVLEMFQQFSNTQTYLNNQTMSWCEDFLDEMRFLIAFVQLAERC